MQGAAGLIDEGSVPEIGKRAAATGSGTDLCYFRLFFQLPGDGFPELIVGTYLPYLPT